ncbi:hypothetical protein HMF3257_38570 [Spirosoma telluris]|uniref:Uncharacterized protein n=1 Tax=Spirosoma telluris TaxID=2183553 RepID=A0A327NDK3_9BACT|nr:hypothetical protein HMF3257_38570 [Spirosoma telluris]
MATKKLRTNGLSTPVTTLPWFEWVVLLTGYLSLYALYQWVEPYVIEVDYMNFLTWFQFR